MGPADGPGLVGHFLRSGGSNLAGFGRKKRIAIRRSFHYFGDGGQHYGNDFDAASYNRNTEEQSPPSGGSAVAGGADPRPRGRWGLRICRALDWGLLPAVVSITKASPRTGRILPFARGSRAAGLSAVPTLPTSDYQSARSEGGGGGPGVPRD